MKRTYLNGRNLQEALYKAVPGTLYSARELLSEHSQRPSIHQTRQMDSRNTYRYVLNTYRDSLGRLKDPEQIREEQFKGKWQDPRRLFEDNMTAADGIIYFVENGTAKVAFTPENIIIQHLSRGGCIQGHYYQEEHERCYEAIRSPETLVLNLDKLSESKWDGVLRFRKRPLNKEQDQLLERLCGPDVEKTLQGLVNNWHIYRLQFDFMPPQHVHDLAKPFWGPLPALCNVDVRCYRDEEFHTPRYYVHIGAWDTTGDCKHVIKARKRRRIAHKQTLPRPTRGED